jgi:hypothetical protein
MKLSRTIQLKAVFLLAVFTLNTMVGFACAVGLDMGFNSKHHHHKDDTITHHHQNNENCCNDEAIQFSQLDKLLAQAVNIGIETPVILVQDFLYHPELSYFTEEEQLSKKPYVSTSRGIRVSIQSFQI